MPSTTITSVIQSPVRVVSMFQHICFALLLSAAISASVAHAQVDANTASDPSAGSDATETQAAAAIERPAFRESETVQVAEVPGTHSSADIRAGDAVSAVPKRFQYAFRLNMRGVYDDNIFLRHTDRVSDFYFAIEPGITLGWGDIVGSDMNSIRFDYSPSIFLYAENDDANAIQHVFRFDGRYRFRRLAVGLAQSIQLLEGTNQPGATSFTSGTTTTPTLYLDTGGNTEVNIYSTDATFSYDLTGKTFLSGALHFTAYDYENLISSQSFQGNLFVNYIYSPKLTAGLGGTFGYNWVEANNPDQTFQQVNLRMNYQATGKIALDGSVGVEFRQFEGDARGDTYVSPVYELGATYQPFDGTTVTLRGSRRTLNSAVFAGQNYAATNINVAIRQRFLRRIYFTLAGGYENTEYFNTVEFVAAERSDNYFFIQPAVDVTLTRYWTFGAYYLHRRDDSSFDSFSFHDNQVGVRTSLTF